MKHQVPESMKFRKLQRKLGLSKKDTVSTLELLWISTQKNCPQGDIGRFTNEEIAIECEWEGDADELVEALTEVRWLDPCADHRLLIHDWEDHAPGWIKRQLKRHGKSILTPSSRPSVTRDADEPTTRPPIAPRDAQEATRNPTQPNPKKPNPTDAGASCSEPSATPPVPTERQLAAADPVVLEFPTVRGTANGPTVWQLRASLVAELSELFPDLDIEARCRSALAWIKAEEGRRKTAKGMRKYLTGWLERDQNSGKGRNQRGSPDRASQPTFREIEAAKFRARHASPPPSDHDDGNLRLRHDPGESGLRGIRTDGR